MAVKEIVCTIVFLMDDERILLGMKKRGFGKDRWNGIGGKVDPGETIEHAAIRECQEEIGVTPYDLEKVAYHRFRFPVTDNQPDMIGHVFISRRWEGTPIETDEMDPRWFAVKDIPYEHMWDDDVLWLPAVLAGKKLISLFDFDDAEHFVTASMRIVPDFA